MSEGDQRRATDALTVVERTSDRELAATRTFDAPVRTVFEAWTRPELFRLWWAPKSSGATLSSCEMDVRLGGRYRLTFGDSPSNTMAFFGGYRDVTPPSRLVWTNEETGGGPITTVTFEDRGEQTLLVLAERYPSSAPLDQAVAGMQAMAPEQFAQLDELLATLRAEATSS